MFPRLFNLSKQTHLEILLKESYHDQLKQFDLMKEFLKSKIYVMGLRKGGELFLVYHEDSLRAFTSVQTLQKAQQDLKNYFYYEVNSILKAMPANIRILLNTGPNYGKEFLPRELAYLKEGKIPPDLTQQYSLKPGQKFGLRLASEIPKKLIDSLFERMKNCPNVEKAYIVEIIVLEVNRPNLIVGIKVLNASNFSKDLVYISEVVRSAVGPKKYVDFIQIMENDTSAIADFMLKETKPFFDKAYI